MRIDDGYYISERTSNERPYARIDSNTLYLPFNVEDNDADEGGYKFQEYRVNIPITKDIEADVLKDIITLIPDVTVAINETLRSVFGEAATVRNTDEYKTIVEVTKEKIVEDDDKTFGIACRALFPVYVQNKQYEVVDVVTHLETGYPYECMTAYDGSVQTDWTIDNRAIWKPWHSRKPEYALPWESPTGAHDIYKAGEYMVWTDNNIWLCVQDTSYSPEDYPTAWEKIG